MTALHFAAKRGRIKVVKFLVKNRAEIEVKDENEVSGCITEGTVCVIVQ